MTVEAQASFQAKAVACPQSGRTNLGLGQQGACQSLGRLGGHRDFEAVFARVTRAGQEAVGAGQVEPATGHEGEGAQSRRLTAGQTGQGVDGERALQREQGALGMGRDADAGTEVSAQVLQIRLPAAGIDDHQPVVGAARDHQVVQQSASGVGEEAIALLERGQALKVDGDERLEGARDGWAAEADLPHVRHVEESGSGPAVFVFGTDATRVLHWHGVAGKRHHARAPSSRCRASRGVVSRASPCAHGKLRVEWRAEGSDVKAELQGRCITGSDALGSVRSGPRCPLYLRD